MAVGVAGVFIETHQDPDKAPSDGPNMVPLKAMDGLLRTLIEFDRLANKGRNQPAKPLVTTAIPPVLKVVGLVVFASTLFTRAVDPVIPQDRSRPEGRREHCCAAVDRLHVPLRAGAARAWRRSPTCSVRRG